MEEKAMLFKKIPVHNERVHQMGCIENMDDEQKIKK
jgi:hypothetical protein